ncbi:Glycosyltransferase family 10 (fucosyltransferase) C-term [Flavobacteriaceae bacterium MAR_2010_188]|nr:Glycosyltransferase family 10 (fucosyltransferase) C-term [Flavobacteriaceae bacterium MAR_2010_188]
MIVRIIKDWDYPDIFRQTPSGTKIWGDVEFTTDNILEFDYLVVLNRSEKEVTFRCRKKGRFLFTQEPPIAGYEWHKKLFGYFDKVYTSWDVNAPNIVHGQGCLPWHIDKTYDELINLAANDGLIKQDKISWITSNARQKPGQILRMDFKDQIEGVLDFDLYGRGFRQIDDKFNVLYPYKYSFALENNSCNDYWTEKISDCFLSWTIPIYSGCTNITDYFPKNSIIQIDPTRPQEAIEKIQGAINEGFWEKNLSSLSEARNLVLNKYQLFPFVVDNLNKNIEKKTWHYLPSNNLDEPIDKKKVLINTLKMRIKTVLNV